MSDPVWNKRFALVESYVAEHLPKLGDPRDAAAAVDVSYEELCARFVRETGIPFRIYVRQARVDEARRLLLRTNVPVEKVCRRVGYSNERVGNQIFVQETGTSMEQYREQYRRKNDTAMKNADGHANSHRNGRHIAR